MPIAFLIFNFTYKKFDITKKNSLYVKIDRQIYNNIVYLN